MCKPILVVLCLQFWRFCSFSNLAKFPFRNMDYCVLHCTLHLCSFLTCFLSFLTLTLSPSSLLILPLYSMETLSSPMDGIIPQLLDFTASHGSTLTRHIQKRTDLHLHLIESFLSLLSAVLDRHSPKRDDSVPYSSSRVGSSYFGSGSGTLSRPESVGSVGSLASLSSDQLHVRSSSARMHSIVDQSYPELHLQSLVLSLPPVNEDSVVVLG